MGFITELVKLLNKFTCDRKAALHDTITDLSRQYAEALAKNNDTEAARIKKKLDNLREKARLCRGKV